MTIDEFREMLSEVIKEEFIESWLTTPNEQFDGLKPIEFVKLGNDERIHEMIYFLKSGTPI